MLLIKPKTRKALTKQVRKLVKRYGADAAVGLITGLVGSIAADRAGKRLKEAQARQGSADETLETTADQVVPPIEQVVPPIDAKPAPKPRKASSTSKKTSAQAAPQPEQVAAKPAKSGPAKKQSAPKKSSQPAG